MSEVIVYVEGRSDVEAMNALLRPLIERKRGEGVEIGFHEAAKGDKKKILLTKTPVRAVHIVLNRPDTVVVVMPDLHPKNKEFPHETERELRQGVLDRFTQALARTRADPDPRLQDRFKVFCFKHDLEALLLASEEQLRRRLGATTLEAHWRKPVEDQDFDNPPKRVVEELFRQHGEKYVAPVDAPAVLESSNYHEIAERCPQCFKPFVEFLESVPA